MKILMDRRRRPAAEHVETNVAFRYHWLVWKLMGIHADVHMRIPTSLYRCHTIFINAFITILFPLTLCANLLHTHNMQQLCENLTITVTDVVANLKFLNVFFVLPKLLMIKDIVQRLDARASAAADERFVLRCAVSNAQRSFRIFGGMYAIGTLLSVLKVYVAGERQLLYPAWFYVDWQRSDRAYACVFGYQLIGLIVQALQNCANDSLPPAYLCVLTGHMKALRLRLLKLGGVERVDALLPAATLERNYHELLACIQDHLLILRLHAIIQHILSLTCLAQFVCSALVQCTVGMHFMYVVDAQDRSAQVLSIIFFTAVTLEVFIICYFGHEMQQQSEALSQAFYSCNWLSQLPAFKRSLLLPIMRTQRVCVIFAGGYIPVDLPTFMRLMKYAYSAFTLLIRFK